MWGDNSISVMDRNGCIVRIVDGDTSNGSGGVSIVFATGGSQVRQK